MLHHHSVDHPSIEKEKELHFSERSITSDVISLSGDDSSCGS
jgi:hypothetical protein